MALRSLHNTLPAALHEQRPKKIPKVSAPHAPAMTAVNDENAAVPPPPMPDAVTVAAAAAASAAPAVVEIDYVASADLEALDDPEARIKTLLEDLESKDWVKVCETLNDLRRFALHHSDLLLPILDKVMLVMVKAMKNPRSALCKTSIMASTDIFSSIGSLLLPSTSEEAAFDQLLLQLLLKASQDKRFVCEEAEKALEKMAAYVPPIPLLGKLQRYVKHTNLKVRAKAAVSISTCVSKMGTEIMKEFGLVTLLQIAGQLLNDRLPEARESARNIANMVYGVFSRDDELKDSELSVLESWQNFCSSNLPPISAQSIVKIASQQ